METQNNKITSQKSLMIVNAVLNPDQKAAFTYYSEESAHLFEKAGGHLVGKYKISESLIGDTKLELVAIVEFPNSEIIKDFLDSEDYKTLLPFRDVAFYELDVFIGE